MLETPIQYRTNDPVCPSFDFSCGFESGLKIHGTKRIGDNNETGFYQPKIMKAVEQKGIKAEEEQQRFSDVLFGSGGTAVSFDLCEVPGSSGILVDYGKHIRKNSPGNRHGNGKEHTKINATENRFLLDRREKGQERLQIPPFQESRDGSIEPLRSFFIRTGRETQDIALKISVRALHIRAQHLPGELLDRAGWRERAYEEPRRAAPSGMACRSEYIPPGKIRRRKDRDSESVLSLLAEGTPV
jgi:hypothetical protein